MHTQFFLKFSSHAHARDAYARHFFHTQKFLKNFQRSARVHVAYARQIFDKKKVIHKAIFCPVDNFLITAG